MEIDPTEFPFLSNIGFMLTYRCTVACPHCIVRAGPNRKEEMKIEHCLSWMEQAKNYRNGHIYGLALTGGEPFYNLENLVRISSYGHALGFIVSVVTNAFWATTEEKALSVLSQVPALRMISISTDVYHQKAIPFSNIRNAIGAARKLNRLYNIAVCTDNEEDLHYRRIINELQEIGEAGKISTSITFPLGRAQANANHYHYRNSPEPTVSACSMAGSPIIFPDGNVIACIGPLFDLPPRHPLYLGNLYREALSEILDRAELNPILHAIRVWGPHQLIALLKRTGFGELLPTNYLCDCVCDACYKMLSDECIVDVLETMFLDEQLRQTVAYARVHYLNETTMADRMQLSAADGGQIVLGDLARCLLEKAPE